MGVDPAVGVWDPRREPVMARDDVLPTHVGAGGAPVSAWSSRPNSTPSRSAGGFINPVASTSSHFAPPSLEVRAVPRRPVTKPRTLVNKT